MLVVRLGPTLIQSIPGLLPSSTELSKLKNYLLFSSPHLPFWLPYILLFCWPCCPVLCLPYCLSTLLLCQPCGQVILAVFLPLLTRLPSLVIGEATAGCARPSSQGHLHCSLNQAVPSHYALEDLGSFLKAERKEDSKGQLWVAGPVSAGWQGQQNEWSTDPGWQVSKWRAGSWQQLKLCAMVLGWPDTI